MREASSLQVGFVILLKCNHATPPKGCTSIQTMAKKVVIAIGAHPDDIEFYMAGTLLMLKKAGYEAHYLNLASGNCGSADYNGATTRSIRNTEARAAAKTLGASFHPSIAY